MRRMVLILVLGLVTIVLPLAVRAGEREPVGTTFTYQGQLEDDSAPADGVYDLRFRLYDSAVGDDQVGSTVTAEDVAVTDGTFTVRIEFGDVWDGTALWLDIGVRPGSSTGAFTALSPLQPLSAAPAALTLRPGARIEANFDTAAVLSVTNSSSAAGASAHAISGRSTNGCGVNGLSDGGGFGVCGTYTHPSGTGRAVSGFSTSDTGEAIYGRANASSGLTTGVLGRADSPDGRGVVGFASSSSGQTRGVYGKSQSTDGYGVYGWATAASGTTTGVLGKADSSDGHGVYGSAPESGVYGEASATSGASHGVYGESQSTDGYGVYGLASATSGAPYGVYGRSSSTDGHGVHGYAETTTGSNSGVYGETSSTDGHGVHGYAGTTTGYNSGVYGETSSTVGRGVYGTATASTGFTRGVFGQCDSTQGRGVYGYASATSGTNYGVYGNTSSSDGYAGYFADRVHVNGDLSASGAKPFKIDHPLAPDTEYLYHFAQEAPEVQNVYNGVVQLDADGAATVSLPAYFSALNTGVFRYQLTAIGAAMPNLHVAKRIETDTFSIAGGEPGHEVSWEVTAVRNDPYVRDHRLTTEAPKTAAERGTYLYPEGYGQPEALSRDHEPHDEAP